MGKDFRLWYLKQSVFKESRFLTLILVLQTLVLQDPHNILIVCTV